MSDLLNMQNCNKSISILGGSAWISDLLHCGKQKLCNVPYFDVHDNFYFFLHLYTFYYKPCMKIFSHVYM